jgi:hypothetical protein
MTATLISLADRIKNMESTLFGGPNVAGVVPDTGLVDQVTAIEDSAVFVRNIRRRCTTAEINAGVELLPAVAGFKYRLIDATIIAIGGNAATATAVTIDGTQAASPVALVTAAIAALTRSTIAKPFSANVTVLADGASFVLNDVNTAITVGKTGGTMATATAFDVIASYTLEAA